MDRFWNLEARPHVQLLLANRHAEEGVGIALRNIVSWVNDGQVLVAGHDGTDV